MKIKEITLSNFKNYENLKLRFNQRVNLFYGLNGSGKTNLLDAIHYLSISKSYFSSSDKLVIRHDQEFFRLHGVFTNNDKAYNISVKKRKDQKKVIEFQGAKLETASELLGKIPIVLIAPDDIKIVKQASKERRDLVNRIICQSNPKYLKTLITYNRILAQKNALLKSNGAMDFQLIDQYNHTLIQLGSAICDVRKAMIALLRVYVIDIYHEISKGAEQIDIIYKSQYDTDDIKRDFDNLLQDEIRFKRIFIGTHKDDFEFYINGNPLKKIGSQGQIKSFLYALRVGEYKYLKEKLTEKPILILDDYFEKLDNQRLSLLCRYLKDDTFDQVFLSDTELERTSALLSTFDIPFESFEIQNGKMIKL